VDYEIFLNNDQLILLPSGGWQLVHLVYASHTILSLPLTEILENADIVRFIKSRRIAWPGHVMRMDGKRIRKRILVWKLIGTRIRGRPRKRWTADIEEDIQIMGIRRWRNQCKERAEWKRITEKAKTLSGL
jgi:hypothetical protein